MSALLTAQLREVAERRAALAFAQAKYDEERAVQDAEAATRAMILQGYAADGNKKPADGAGVQVRTKLEYDAAEAFAKAKQMGVAIVPEQLDVKAFEKIAKASPESFPFVKVLEDPSATLASDLSQYLEADTRTPDTHTAPF